MIRVALRTPVRLSASPAFRRAGDVAVVTAIDRLGHSVAEITRTIAERGGRRIMLSAGPGLHGGTGKAVISTVVDCAGAYKNDPLVPVVR